ncbi:MAG TPA: transporter suffix domain-containing protein [Ignavibacteria bacterium]|nr:transporter suffix domain-containing protein [Ignavibacteria bacterium]
MKKKTGYILLAASFLLYAVVAVIPFLGFSGGTAAIVITILIVTAELSFLASVYLLGRGLVKKYRAYMNPLNWFRKKDDPDNKQAAIETKSLSPEELERKDIN